MKNNIRNYNTRRLLKSNSLLSIFNNYLYDSLMPLNINYAYNFGSLLGLFLVIQIISGIFLSFYYVPTFALAFNAVENIMREVPYGWLLRYIHMNSAALFLIVGYLHIARTLIYGSYTKTRQASWNIGVIIFFLMIGTAFLGYSLVMGQQSYWAIAVVTNLLTVIPYFGHTLVEYVYGNFNISNATLGRFYSLHYLLPFIIAALVLAHLITLHSVRGTNPLGLSSIRSISLVNFHPYYSFKDAFGFFIGLIILMTIVFFSPNLIGHPDNYIPADPLVTPQHIVPEVYLLAFFAILRSIPNKVLGVLGLLSAIFVLMLLPYLNNNVINTSVFRPLYKILIFTFFLNFFILTFIGHSVVAEPFITIGFISTMYYFVSLLILLPLISFIELFFFKLLLSKYNKNTINILTI